MILCELNDFIVNLGLPVRNSSGLSTVSSDSFQPWWRK